MATNAERREILERAIAALPKDSEWRGRLRKMLESKSATGIHVAVFVEPYLSAVLDGRKTMESRFGLTRQPPFDCVDSGDIILLKRSGGPVVGVAEAGTARSYSLSPALLNEIKREYSEQLFAQDEEFWESRREKNYATLIELRDTVEVEGVPISKRDRRGWVTYCHQNQLEATSGA